LRVKKTKQTFRAASCSASRMRIAAGLKNVARIVWIVLQINCLGRIMAAVLAT